MLKTELKKKILKNTGNGFRRRTRRTRRRERDISGCVGEGSRWCIATRIFPVLRVGLEDFGGPLMDVNRRREGRGRSSSFAYAYKVSL